MTNRANSFEGLEGFERLDIGELYYVGSRQFVERGLSFYRNFAVEGLAWDGTSKCLMATVADGFSTSYDVSLQVRRDVWSTAASARYGPVPLGVRM